MTVHSVPRDQKLLMNSDKFSDLTISANGREINVHQCIVCPQSSALEAMALTAKPNQPIYMNCDHGPVFAMVEFLYSKDYTMEGKKTTTFNAPLPTPKESGACDAEYSETIMFHIRVNSIAHQFKIPDLVVLSQQKIQEKFEKPNVTLAASRLLKEAFEQPVADDVVYSLLAQETASQSPTLMNDPAFANIDIPKEFCVRLLRACARRETDALLKVDSEKLEVELLWIAEKERMMNDFRNDKVHMSNLFKKQNRNLKQAKNDLALVEARIKQLELENEQLQSEKLSDKHKGKQTAQAVMKEPATSEPVSQPGPSTVPEPVSQPGPSAVPEPVLRFPRAPLGMPSFKVFAPTEPSPSLSTASEVTDSEITDSEATVTVESGETLASASESLAMSDADRRRDRRDRSPLGEARRSEHDEDRRRELSPHALESRRRDHEDRDARFEISGREIETGLRESEARLDEAAPDGRLERLDASRRRRQARKDESKTRRREHENRQAESLPPVDLAARQTQRLARVREHDARGAEAAPRTDLDDARRRRHRRARDREYAARQADAASGSDGHTRRHARLSRSREREARHRAVHAGRRRMRHARGHPEHNAAPDPRQAPVPPANVERFTFRDLSPIPQEPDQIEAILASNQRRISATLARVRDSALGLIPSVGEAPRRARYMEEQRRQHLAGALEAVRLEEQVRMDTNEQQGTTGQ